jgi:hypothetical protein
VNNKGNSRVKVCAAVKGPFVCPVPNFVVEAKCYVFFPIHFAPKKIGRNSGVLRFRSEGSEDFVVELRGTGLDFDGDYE